MPELKSSTVFLAALAAVVACGPKEEAPAPAADPEPIPQPAPVEPKQVVAVAKLAPRADTTARGMVTFTETANGVLIVAHVEGAAPGEHGFHLHETGDCSSADFKSSGGHFNPADVPHGGPADAERHAGDLGNLAVGEDGTGHLELSSSLVTVAPGSNSVVGRAVVLHEKADDLVSQPTGAAGGRVACGVIELEKMSSGGAGDPIDPMMAGGGDSEGGADDDEMGQ